MTDTQPICDICNDEGKVTKWTVIEGNYVDDGEEDCSCVIERIESDRADAMRKEENI